MKTWEVYTSAGVFTIEAYYMETDHGCLNFKNALGLVFHSYAPGEWRKAGAKA